MEEKQDYLVIKVNSFKWNSESYGLGYYTFEINVTMNKEENIIRRRYSEIEWLNQMLIITSAGCLIPKLPEKSLWTNFTYHSDELINDRKNKIEEYLIQITKHKYLVLNEYFLKFIKKGFDINKEEVQKKTSYFSSFKSMIGMGGSKSNTSISCKFYDQKDKEYIQRLAKGINEILKSYEKYLKINITKVDSIFKIKNISNNLKTFYNKKEIYDNILNDKSNLDQENIENVENIFNNNIQYLENIEKSYSKSNEEMKKKIELLTKYYSKVEEIEKIFIRLDNLLTDNSDFINIINSNSKENKLESYEKKFKEQLKNELNIFKENERNIFDLIENLFKEKLFLNESILKVFSEEIK